MKIGVLFPQPECIGDRASIRDYAQTVEALGFHHISSYEHILGVNPERPGGWDRPFTYQSPFLEPFALFSFLAAVTEGIGLMTRVLIAPQRQTVLVAKQAATLDVLCNGRLQLGLGIGWNEAEYIAQGEDFVTRGARIEEQVYLLRQLWTQPLVNFQGKWHTVPDAGINPLPVRQPIPLWIGGHSDHALRRVAELGDGWLPNDLTQPETEKLVEKLHLYIVEAGRSPGKVGVDARLSYAEGNPDTWLDGIQHWQSVGATQLTIDTMGSNFRTLDDHIQALRVFAGATGLKREW